MARRRQKKTSIGPHRSRAGTPVENATFPKNLEQINHHAAGIDIGSREHYVAIPAGRDSVVVRSFGTFTADLHALADWLQQCGITTIAMESTGVYWIAVFELLESRGFEVKLVQPARLKNVPGRKTDVLDCQWIQQLHTYGLLEGSFRPDEEVAVLRSYLRQRDRMVQLAAEHIQHMQKALTEMNVQLHHVIDDITGTTGLRILDAILAGERDTLRLAELRHSNCKNNVETIALALEGTWREEHLFALQQALDSYRFYQQKLLDVDRRIEACLQAFEDRSEGRELPQDPRAPQKPGSKPRKQKNGPAFDCRALLHRMTGVDLTAINGIGPMIALGLISEIGTDMSKWPSENHFSSWLTLCPGNHRTGGKQHKSKTQTRTSSNRAAHLLRLAAQSLWKVDCALGAYFRRMKARRGSPKAIVATAHKLARFVYRMLKYGTTFEDRGAKWYEAQFRERQLQGLCSKAKELGFALVSVGT
jgi:transposase